MTMAKVELDEILSLVADEEIIKLARDHGLNISIPIPPANDTHILPGTVAAGARESVKMAVLSAIYGRLQ